MARSFLKVWFNCFNVNIQNTSWLLSNSTSCAVPLGTKSYEEVLHSRVQPSVCRGIQGIQLVSDLQTPLTQHQDSPEVDKRPQCNLQKFQRIQESKQLQSTSTLRGGGSADRRVQRTEKEGSQSEGVLIQDEGQANFCLAETRSSVRFLRWLVHWL